MANILEIDILGIDYYDKVEKNIIYRVNRKQLPPSPLVTSSPSSLPSLSLSIATTTYPYLIVSEKIEELLLSSSSSPVIDIFGIRSFRDFNDDLKKKVKKKGGIGLEVTLADLRKSDGSRVGKWFSQIRDLYKFCKSSNCQFILSSGANSIEEMVSGRSFDAILKICDIKPEGYWQELGKWIESKSRYKVFINTQPER
jgi:RNase P/RNase MRP subunit p30